MRGPFLIIQCMRLSAPAAALQEAAVASEKNLLGFIFGVSFQNLVSISCLPVKI